VRYDADVLVVGGGPIGLAAATHAARAGMSTIVVEQRSGTVDKACGEGLMPTAVARLRSLGVRPPGQPFHGIRYVEGRRSAEAFFTAGTGLGVRRTALHQALDQVAATAGVDRIQARVAEIGQDATAVTAAGLRSRWLLAADGLHSGVRRALGLELPVQRHRRVPRRYGLRRHVAVEPWTDLVEVHWSPHAEAYVTPVDPYQVGVAVLFSGRGYYDDWLMQFPGLAERLRGVPVASRIRGAGPLLQRTRRRSSGRVLLIGDAAGYVDALTGEGINVGLASAVAAVDCIERGRPGEYEGQWVRLSRPYRALTEGLLRARYQPLLRPAIVPAAQRFPRIFTAIVDRLG
jgi:flavin-dependent dehydrogenase